MNENLIILMIGNRIRQQRKAQHLSLRELSNRTNLSNALLSKIENGKVSSPISTYIKITDALNIDFKDLVNSNQELDLLYIPKSENETHDKKELGAHGYSFKPIGSKWPNHNFNAFIITYYPTSSDRPRFTSDVDELLFVIEGQIEFFHGDNRLLLEVGDSLILNANISHGGKAFGGKKARGIYLSLRRN